MATGSDSQSRGAIPESVSKRDISSADDIQRVKYLSGGMVGGDGRWPSKPAKPEVEIKTASGREAADIECLSPSHVESRTKESCSVIPVEMEASGANENGSRPRNRIRIVLGGKQFPVPVSSQLQVPDSLRSISLYSDDEVDCNDDGRSLDRPSRTAMSDKILQDHPKLSDFHKADKLEVLPIKDDVPSAADDSKQTQVDDKTRKTGVCLTQSQVDDRKTKAAAVCLPECQERKDSAAADVDDRSRFLQRHRVIDERGVGLASAREGQHKHDFSERKIRSTEADFGQRLSARQSSVRERQSRLTELTDGHIVSVDRGVTSYHRTAVERHETARADRERTGSSNDRARNEASRSRSRHRRDSGSRSPSRHGRDDTRSSSRYRCLNLHKNL